MYRQMTSPLSHPESSSSRASLSWRAGWTRFLALARVRRHAGDTRAVMKTLIVLIGLVELAAGLGAVGQTHRELLLRPDVPEFTQPAPAVSLVRFETSKGVIDIEVTRAWSPLGADRFVALARHGFFDEARFFRITPGRWAQFGIP